MIKSDIRVVDGLSYEITKFSATKALRLFVRLGQYFGEALAILQNENPSVEVDNRMVSSLVSAIFKHLDENKAESLVKELLETTRCENKPILFDTHFQGRLLHLFKVLGAVLEVQYGDFFVGTNLNFNVEQKCQSSAQTT